tara:strand:+ start:362 stop:907 length:546 start_codon:yes stop_codon:yes gene_type:complete
MDIDERYVNGKIYKIVCNETGKVYYGSTIKKLKYRINNHINERTCESKQIINRNNYYYELIENYSCNNEYELKSRERWYIENNDCINKVIPIRTKEEIKEYQKKWYEDNKEKVNDRKRNWYEKNKEKILEYHKELYHKNKEKINEKMKEKILCDICGSIVSRRNLKRHQLQKKCLIRKVVF